MTFNVTTSNIAQLTKNCYNGVSRERTNGDNSHSTLHQQYNPKSISTLCPQFCPGSVKLYFSSTQLTLTVSQSHSVRLSITHQRPAKKSNNLWWSIDAMFTASSTLARFVATRYTVAHNHGSPLATDLDKHARPRYDRSRPIAMPKDLCGWRTPL